MPTHCDYFLRPSIFLFKDAATTEIYTLSLHDALPISLQAIVSQRVGQPPCSDFLLQAQRRRRGGDRKSTRLNSSHTVISYAVFCLKKKNTEEHAPQRHSWRERDSGAGDRQSTSLNSRR